tara:strand:- start:137085 stop:137195 length:111 start_codon:yes stop_codon:yes gene_type:complete
MLAMLEKDADRTDDEVIGKLHDFIYVWDLLRQEMEK